MPRARRIRLLSTLAALLPCAVTAGPDPLAAQDGITGTLVVVNKGEATLSVIDAGSGAIHGRVPTGQGPHEVVLTGDGSTAIVTDYGTQAGGSTLTVVDVAERRVVRTVDLGRHTRPHGISVLPGDELVAVTSEASGHVVLVRIADGEIVSEIPTGHPGSHMLAMVGDGETIYTSNMGDGTVSQLEVDSADLVRSVAVAPRLEAIGVANDGSEVWVGSNEEGTVSIVRPGGDEVETALDGFEWPYRILFTPDRALVLIPDLGRNELRIVDRASRTELARLEFPGGRPQGITLDDDASHAFLSLAGEGRLVIIDLEAREVVRSVDTGPTPDGVAFTPRVFGDGPS
ncbi:MAG: hypothetical protein R3195_18020 [Gemmatimonadota bacterium]|nr:hypothetical protein [Gemmatimonadota bacterium]